MKTKQWILLLAVALICVLCIVTLIKRGNGIRDQDTTVVTNDRPANARDAKNVSFDEAKEQATGVIRQREVWPESPVAVSEAFWIARADKDYAEMQVLWPGSASFNWPELCKSDANVEYVFGQATADGTQVPYAAKGDFEKNKTYNLTMRLSVLDTDRGPRYYIVSGN
jgi:hypothetical protein